MNRAVFRIFVVLIVVVGATWGNLLKSPELNCQVWVIKLDEKGNALWTKAYGEKGYWYTATFAGETSDGGLIIAGTYYEWFMEDQFWLMKIDSTLELDWENDYPIPNVPPDTFIDADADTFICERPYSPRRVSETETGGFIVECVRPFYWEGMDSYPVLLVEVSRAGKWLSRNYDSLITQPLSESVPISRLLDNYPKWLVGSRIFPVSDGGFIALGISSADP